jgi:hypothetical protein
VSRSFCKLVLLSARGRACRCLALARGQPCLVSQDVSRRHNTVVRSLSENRLHARMVACSDLARTAIVRSRGIFFSSIFIPEVTHLHPRQSPISIPDVLSEGDEEASDNELVGGPVSAEHENGVAPNLGASRAPTPLFPPSTHTGMLNGSRRIWQGKISYSGGSFSPCA